METAGRYLRWGLRRHKVPTVACLLWIVLLTASALTYVILFDYLPENKLRRTL